MILSSMFFLPFLNATNLDECQIPRFYEFSLTETSPVTHNCPSKGDGITAYMITVVSIHKHAVAYRISYILQAAIKRPLPDG